MTIIPAHPIPNAVRTTCPYYGVGCGVFATPQAGGNVSIQGDPMHPTNAGRLCAKGSVLGETISLRGRLLCPVIRQCSHDLDAPITLLQRVTRNTALDTVARGFRRIIDEHGPDAVAFYVSGQLLTKGYCVANKLTEDFISTASIGMNSRLCMSPTVTDRKRAFGEDLVSVCYDDLEAADLIMLVSSNTAWYHPILFQRIARVKEVRLEMKVVVVDPRHTAMCELVDLRLPVKPDTDVRLFNDLLSFLLRYGVVDRNFVTLHTNGLDTTLKTTGTGSDDAEAVAKAYKLKPDDLLAFYSWFADMKHTITAFSTGANQPTAGAGKANSIINCHLPTGRIGRIGTGSFLTTGQSNAVGDRGVGGLTNILAARMELNDPSHRDLVQTLWVSPCAADRMSPKAVDLFRTVGDGRVKAVWIIGTSPVVSLPDTDQTRRTLAECRLAVVLDIVEATNVTALADILLPALSWGEKDGTVTDSGRRIPCQYAFLPAPGETHADRDVIVDIARRMEYSGLDLRSPGNVFDEHARLSAYANDASGIRRAFHLGGLAGLDAGAHDNMSPV